MDVRWSPNTLRNFYFGKIFTFMLAENFVTSDPIKRIERELWRLFRKITIANYITEALKLIT
jgi:hypothetical protein